MIDQSERVTFTDLFNLSVTAISRNLRTIAVFGIGLGIVLSLFDGLGSSGGLLSLIAQIAGIYYLTIALLKNEGFFRPDERVGNFGAYFGASILSGLGMVFGMVLLIVPGLILLSRWWLAPALAIAENRSTTEAMRASWEATRESQWSMVGFIVVVGFAYVLLLGVLGVFSGTMRSAAVDGVGTPGFMSLLGINLVSMLGSACWTAMSVALLRRLRRPTAGLDEIFS